MSNEYFTKTGNPGTGAQGASAAQRAEFALIEAGFDKLPALAGNAGKVVGINAGATGMVVLTAAEVRLAAEVVIGTNVQAYDADLSAISALSSVGIAVRTALNTWAQRTLTAGSAKVSITNGDGVSGNPTIDVAEASLTLNNIGGTLGITKGGTGAITAPLARTALGSTAVGDAVFIAANSAAARTAIGAIGEGDFNAAGDILIGQASADGVVVSMPLGGAQIINGKISLSVGASALTAALKGLDGNDPSATNPVFIRIPQNTAGVFDGTYAIRKVTAALSVVVSSGSTLGHTSAVACPVYFYLLDNAGTPELAVSTKFFGTPAVVSTTAEGGAGAADSRTVMYSTTARTNVSAAVIGRWKSTQTTAGTWAAVTGEQQLYPFPYKKPKITKHTAPGANTHTKDWDVLWARVQVSGGGGGSGGAGSTVAGQAGASGGGGAGGYALKVMDAADYAATETATVGASGIAGTAGATTGGTGGTSSFGSHASATGGEGSVGVGARGDVLPTLPGTSGIGSGGDINLNGGGGECGITAGGGGVAYGGKGGQNPLSGSFGGFQNSSTWAGVAGQIYGGGATGAGNGPSQAATAGAAGGPGVVIVEEFYQ